MSYIIKGIENPIKVPIDQLPKLDNPPVYIKVVNINDWVPSENNRYSIDIPQNIHGLKSPYWILSIETINADKSMISNDTCSYILSNTGTITIISDIKTTIRVTIMGSSMDPQEYIIKVSDDIINKQNKMEGDISAIQQNAVTTDQILDIITGGEDPSQLTPEKILQNLLGGKTLLDIQYPVGSIYMSTSSTNPSTIMGGTWIAWGSGRVPVGVDTTDTDFSTVEAVGGEKTHTLTVEEMPTHTHIQDAHTHLQQAHTHIQNPHTHSQEQHTHDMYHQHPVGWTNDGGDLVRISYTASQSTARMHEFSYTGNTGGVIAKNLDTTAINQETIGINENTTAVNQSTGGSVGHNILQPYITCYMWKRTL